MDPNQLTDILKKQKLMNDSGALDSLKNMASGGAAEASGGFDMYALGIAFMLSFVGMFYFRHGKKNDSPAHKYAGVAMMIFPYFIHSFWGVTIVGTLLCFAPKIADIIFRNI